MGYGAAAGFSKAGSSSARRRWRWRQPGALARVDARLRGRRRQAGDPLHRAHLAVVLLPRLLRLGPAFSVAGPVHALATAQPAPSRAVLRGLAPDPRRRHRLFCGDGAAAVRTSHLAGLLHLRRHRLRVHHRDGGDLVRSNRWGRRPARLAPAAHHRRLLSLVAVHGQLRHADRGDAELRLGSRRRWSPRWRCGSSPRCRRAGTRRNARRCSGSRERFPLKWNREARTADVFVVPGQPGPLPDVSGLGVQNRTQLGTAELLRIPVFTAAQTWMAGTYAKTRFAL